MKRIVGIGSLLISGVLGISTSYLFEGTFNLSYIIGWSFYIWIWYLIFWVFWLFTYNGLFGGFLGIYRTKKVIGIVIILVFFCLFIGFKIHKSGYIELYSYQIAERVSTHVKFESGKLPCINIGQPCP